MLTREMMAVLGDWHERLETDLAGLESYEDSMLDRHRLEVGALRAALDTLGKLPVTADGVVCVVGVDEVYDGSPNTCHCWGGATSDPDRTRRLPLDIVLDSEGRPVPDGLVPWSSAYSTDSAARQAGGGE